MSKNFFEALHEIATDKGIPREYIEQIVESAMLSAFKKQYGMIENVRVVFDRDKNSVKVVSKKMVVKTARNMAEEISLARGDRRSTRTRCRGTTSTSRRTPSSRSAGSPRRPPSRSSYRR